MINASLTYSLAIKPCRELCRELCRIAWASWFSTKLATKHVKRRSGADSWLLVKVTPRNFRSLGVAITVVITLLSLSAQAASPFAELDRTDTVCGYLARLLINETAFPGERGFVSKTDSQSSLLAVLWVLHSRIQFIPKGYTQIQVAGVRSANIIDVITGAGGKRQCEGFYCNASGQFVTADRVEERVQNLLRIANSGDKPGRFAELLNDAQGLARAYLQDGIEGADRFAGLKRAGGVEVTGRAYSWMTDVGTWHPGGNFVSIPSVDGGALAGNRFFTLRKVPK